MVNYIQIVFQCQANPSSPQ